MGARSGSWRARACLRAPRLQRQGRWVLRWRPGPELGRATEATMLHNVPNHLECCLSLRILVVGKRVFRKETLYVGPSRTASLAQTWPHALTVRCTHTSVPTRKMRHPQTLNHQLSSREGTVQAALALPLSGCPTVLKLTFCFCLQK